MRLPQDYDPEPLIEAVTALDWSVDHPTRAMKALKTIVHIKFGDELSDYDAIKLLSSLIERQFIKTRVHPEDLCRVSSQPIARKAKYVRVPPTQRNGD